MMNGVEMLIDKGFYSKDSLAGEMLEFGGLAKGILNYTANYAKDEKSAFDYAKYEKIIPKSENNHDKSVTAIDIVTIMFNTFDLYFANDEQKLEKAIEIIGTCDFNAPLTKGQAAPIIDKLLTVLKQEIFRNPTNSYRVFPMEHEISEDIRQITPFLIDTGAGGGVINASWKNGWNQNTENLEMLKQTAEIFKQKHLHAWIYDDVYYPSGWADGYIEKKNPDFIEKNIGCIYTYGEGKKDICVTLPANGHYFIYAAFYPLDENGVADYENPQVIEFSVKEIKAESIEAKWELAAFYVRDCNIWPYEWANEISPPIGPRKHLSHLDTDAVDAFVEGALGVVENYMGDLSEYFDAVFTDESGLNNMYIYGKRGKPSFESVPFGNSLFSEFKDTFGYDLKTVLPYLFTGRSEKAKTVRIQYYSIIARQMSEHFVGRISKWCRERGVHFSGHLHSEEGMHFHVGNYGDYIKAVKEMDYPGFDMLCSLNRMFWTKGEGISTNAHFLSGKYTASATKIKGINKTMVEICPVSHQEEFFKDIFNQFISFTTSTVFIGATHVNLYGYRFLSQADDFIKFNEYTGRICYFARNATNDARVGLYYPIVSMQANIYSTDTKLDDLSPYSKELNNYMENLAYFLYNNRLDFSFITDEAINEAAVHENKLSIMLQNYRVVLLPKVDAIPLSTLEKLVEFEKSGGKVIFLDRLPQMGVSDNEHKAVREIVRDRELVNLKLSNLAINAKVVSSHTCEGYNERVVTDGSCDCEFCWDGFSSDVLPATLTITLPETTEFNRMDLYSKIDYEQTEYKAFYRQNDDWILFSEKDDNKYFHMIDEFEMVKAQEIRLVFYKGNKTQPEIARLNEVQLYKVRNSESRDPFAAMLHETIGTTLKIAGADENSIKVADYRYEGRRVYFIINSSATTQIIDIYDSNAAGYKVYNPVDGEITSYSGEFRFELKDGRGVFIEITS
jgi:hypothetical protein